MSSLTGGSQPGLLSYVSGKGRKQNPRRLQKAQVGETVKQMGHGSRGGRHDSLTRFKEGWGREGGAWVNNKSKRCLKKVHMKPMSS